MRAVADFELTEEQKLLKANARDFMDMEIMPLVDDYERRYRLLRMVEPSSG